MVGSLHEVTCGDRTGSRAVAFFGRGCYVGAANRACFAKDCRGLGVTARRENDLARVLGDPQLPMNVPIFRTHDVNSTDTQNVLRELSPEVLCVYGTYIVREQTLSIAPISLNLHTGISPRYRGADCYFWPLYNAEPDWVGATVHRCTSEVDGGEIYETAMASLEAEDGLGAIFGRSVVAGTEIYKRTVERLLAGLSITPRAQRLSAGTKYFARMRGWKAEIRVAWLIHRGLIRRFSKVDRGRTEARDT